MTNHDYEDSPLKMGNSLIISKDSDKKPVEFMTLEEMTTPKVKRVVDPTSGKAIEYLHLLPLDVLADLQLKYQRPGNKDALGFYCAVLYHVLVNPKFKDFQEARRVGPKISSALSLQILSDVLGSDETRKLEQELGER